MCSVRICCGVVESEDSVLGCETASLADHLRRRFVLLGWMCINGVQSQRHSRPRPGSRGTQSILGTLSGHSKEKKKKTKKLSLKTTTTTSKKQGGIFHLLSSQTKIIHLASSKWPSCLFHRFACRGPVIRWLPSSPSPKAPSALRAACAGEAKHRRAAGRRSL